MTGVCTWCGCPWVDHLSPREEAKSALLEAPSVVGFPADLPADGASSGRTPKADGNSAHPPAAHYDPIARLSVGEQQLLDAA